MDVRLQGFLCLQSGQSDFLEVVDVLLEGSTPVAKTLIDGLVEKNLAVDWLGNSLRSLVSPIDQEGGGWMWLSPGQGWKWWWAVGWER